MQGRVHLYEGYSPQEITFPIRVFGRMGIGAVILTNAAGGINLSYSQGALVLIRDHINLQGANPLVGPNDDRFGVRFPDMTHAYAKEYRADRPGRSRQAEDHFTGGHLRRPARPQLRDSRGDRVSPPHRRRPGGNVDGGRSNRRAPHGNQSARDFLRHQHGRRNPRPAALPRRSHGNR